MELQIRDGSPNRNQSMVLNLHFSHRANKYQGSNWFMAEVYETTTQGERQGNPIFYCSGKRFEEWKEASAFIVLLLSPGQQTTTSLSRYRDLLARWFLRCQTAANLYHGFSFNHSVCIKVCTERWLQDLFQPQAWISTSTSPNGSQDTKLVLEELEEALRLPLLETEALDAANDPSF